MPIPSPLKDKTILVTRAVEQSSQFSQLLQEVGAKVLEMPTLAIHPPSSWSALDLAINSLNQLDWLILTSANGVDYFFNRLRTLKKDARDLAGVKIAVVGKKTASSLQKWGLIADYIPADFIADALVLNFPETLLGKKILFPRVETGGREILVQELSHQGAEVIEVPAYQSGCPEKIDPQVWQALQAKTIDTITFASSKTVQNFVTLVNQALGFYPHLSLELLLKNVRIASIGPQTSKTCSELLGRVDVEAKEYTLEGLVEALCND
jgi:uroporphyrinogen III methyltransferase/synthase